MPEKPSKLLPALYGGIIIGVISAIPFLNFVNCLCCAGVLFGGYMAVFFYRKDLPPALPLESSDGIQLGALAGLFGAIVGLFLTGVVYLIVGNVAGKAMTDMLMNVYDSMGILDQMPPEAIDQMEMSAQESPLNAMTIVGSLIIDPLFGLLGGLIGYQIHKPKGGMPPATPAATPPPAV